MAGRASTDQPDRAALRQPTHRRGMDLKPRKPISRLAPPHPTRKPEVRVHAPPAYRGLFFVGAQYRESEHHRVNGRRSRRASGECGASLSPLPLLSSSEEARCEGAGWAMLRASERHRVTLSRRLKPTTGALQCYKPHSPFLRSSLEPQYQPRGNTAASGAKLRWGYGCGRMEACSGPAWSGRRGLARSADGVAA